MYCGDETGSFVGEVGSHTSRFGYGGDDAPKFVVPSSCLPATPGGGSDAAATPGARRRKPAVRLQRAASCYRWRGGTGDDSAAGGDYRTPLRRAQVPDADASAAAAIEPIVDPNGFLSQGEAINDWDAYASLWESAMDSLKVRDAFKHSSNRNRSQPEHASGLSSTNLSTATGRFSEQLPESGLAHPMLVIRPGFTHLHGTRGDNEPSFDAAVAMVVDPGDGNPQETSAVPKADAADAQQRHHRAEMEKLVELFVEDFGAKAVFVAPAPMLAAFSHGRQTALVVDVGASGCRVTPVVDGLLLRQAQRRSGRGGDWMGNVAWRALNDALQLQQQQGTATSPIQLRPRYHVSGSGAGAPGAGSAMPPPRGVFHRWAMQDLMYEIRTSSFTYLQPWCYDPSVPFYGEREKGSSTMPSTPPVFLPPVGIGSASSSDGAGNASSSEYELPDGTRIDMTTPTGKDLCRIPELLFTDELPFLSTEEHEARTARLPSTLSDLSIPRLIYASLSAVGDVDVRKDLASSILLTGGSSLVPNMEQRLSIEVPRIVSSAYKTKVTASKHSVERACASWIGGSILTSLGSFQQLWLSRAEYEEYGATLAVQRFPV